MLDDTLLTNAALLLALDLIGTFVFAISGAASGVKSRLDVFGVSVLAFVAGLPTALAGACVCFIMRLSAIRRGWRLPVANDDGLSSARPE